MRSRVVRAALAAFLLFGCAGSLGAASNSLLITNVTVIDPDAPASERIASVKITDGIIEAVEPPGSTADHYGMIVDGAGKFLIPGLWDCHAHAFGLGIESLRSFLAYGVTGIRDVGSDPAIVTWRTRIAAGELLGPRIITSGPILRGGTGQSEGASIFVDTPEDAVAAVKGLQALGVDFVKVHEGFTRNTWHSLAGAARSAGLRVIGHVSTSVTVWEAIEAGQTGIEHSLRIPLAISADEKTLRAKAAKAGDPFYGYLYADQEATRSPSAARERRLIQTLRSHQVAICPTLTDMRALAIANVQSIQRDDRFAALPPPLQREWVEFFEALERNPAERAAYSELFRYALLWVGRLHQAGVTILAGTDTLAPGDFPGSDLHSELELLVLAGLSPLEALRSATVAPQVFHRLSAGGALIAPGQPADLVLLKANPLIDIRHSRSIELVIRRGDVLKPAELLH
jgi:imidazolonepropionase-like amidohydrolase